MASAYTIPVIYTNAGRAAMQRAMQGAELLFTRVGIGRGVPTGQLEEREALVEEVLSADIVRKFTPPGNQNQTQLDYYYTTSGLAEGFYVKETGLYFRDQDGDERLFYYSPRPETRYEYLPGAPEANESYEGSDSFLIELADDGTIQAVLNTSMIFATVAEMTDVRAEIVAGQARDLRLHLQTHEQLRRITGAYPGAIR